MPGGWRGWAGGRSRGRYERAREGQLSAGGAVAAAAAVALRDVQQQRRRCEEGDAAAVPSTWSPGI